MVTCPVCNKHVDYKYLRTENPRDELDHDLGTWVHCENKAEKHVYLRPGPPLSSSSENKNQTSEGKCPYCDSMSFSKMKGGEKVKCIHVNDQGIPCQARPYVWFEEGPPCFMNHIGKIRLL